MPLHHLSYVLRLFDVVCSLAKMKADPNFSAASSCSELEKLVGRRINPGVSLAEQQERFPFLKDAPVEHAYAAGVKVRARAGLIAVVTVTSRVLCVKGHAKDHGCALEVRPAHKETASTSREILQNFRARQS